MQGAGRAIRGRGGGGGRGRGWRQSASSWSHHDGGGSGDGCRSGMRGRGRGWGWRGAPSWLRGGRGGRGPSRERAGSSSTATAPPLASPSNPHLVQTSLISCPYSSWKGYFHDEAFEVGSSLVKVVKAFEAYFKSNLGDYCDFLDDVEFKGYLPVDCAVLLGDTALCESLPDLYEEIKNHPLRTLDAAALAFHTVLSASVHQADDDEGGVAVPCNQQEGEGEQERGGGGGGPDTTASMAAEALAVPAGGGVVSGAAAYAGNDSDSSVSPQAKPSLFDLQRLYIRLYNYQPLVPLKNLKAPQYGKCVSVKGTVVRVSSVRPLVTRLAFKCQLCHEEQVLALQDGKYALPSKCLTDGCRGRSFAPLRSSPLTQTIDWQTIRVQELAMDERRETGRVPRTIECELTADLVDSCVPGDLVTITAVVKATSSEDVRSRNSRDKCMFLLYLFAISVSNDKASSGDASACALPIDFSTKDYYAIQEIQADKNVFRLIVGSLCPAIYGHELVKAGLVLGLFGGTQQNSDFTDCVPVRADPHILVVGDPGLGKSQMLQAAANLAPRGVYVCGSTTTTAGLTVTLVKEGGGGGGAGGGGGGGGSSGDYTLEAGALILADQGCCCIDEFDKMGSQHQALLEAMEQQSISIAKAGVLCSLPARASILAAANPTGGHYNKAKTVSENLKMSSALLSRFDLVFILLDKPDEDMDCMLSEHVMSLHAGTNRNNVLVGTARRNREATQSQSILALDEEQSLVERLKVNLGTEALDPVPCQLLRKYIGYARKYAHPKLSREAADVLQKFYLEMRKHRQSADCTPITTRQLESLIRLTEARARLELREIATARDASDVVEIMKFSMYETFSDELGVLDFQRSQHGSGMSQRGQAKRFIAELSRVADHNASPLFTVSSMKDVAKRIGINVQNFDDFIFSLNNQNFLLKKGPRTYQLQTASCL